GAARLVARAPHARTGLLDCLGGRGGSAAPAAIVGRKPPWRQQLSDFVDDAQTATPSRRPGTERVRCGQSRVATTITPNNKGGSATVERRGGRPRRGWGEGWGRGAAGRRCARSGTAPRGISLRQVAVLAAPAGACPHCLAQDRVHQRLRPLASWRRAF